MVGSRHPSRPIPQETSPALQVDVADVPVALDAPEDVAAGDTVAVAWEGPENAGDYITIVAAGAPEGSYADYAYTRDGTPVEIAAPEAPGLHEVRYVSGGGDSTVESVDVEVR